MEPAAIALVFIIFRLAVAIQRLACTSLSSPQALALTSQHAGLPQDLT